MREIWKNKKIRMGVLVLCILILVGVTIGIALKGDGNQTDKEDGKQDIIVHETDKDTVETTKTARSLATAATACSASSASWMRSGTW